MEDYSKLVIPTVLKKGTNLMDIIYNCPVCDYEIYINMIINIDSFIKCENCNHEIKLQLNKI